MAFFKWEDYVIFTVTLIVTMGMGLYFSRRGGKQRKHRSTSEYLAGDGNMSSFPVAVLLMVSYESGITMLGVPAEVYMYGMQWYLSVIGYLLGDLLVIRAIIPSLKRLKFISIYEYLERRYNSHAIRMFATILGLCYMLNYLGTVLYVPAIALESVTNIPIWISIVGLMAVVVVYTCFGGFQGVIWTDVFQAFLMFGGIFAILIKGTIKAGGMATTWRTVVNKGRLDMFNFNPDPTIRQSFWSLIFGCTIIGITAPFRQPVFQRIVATPTVKSAQWMYLSAAVLYLFIDLVIALEGVVMFAYFDHEGCDPLVTKLVTNPNQLFAKMVTDIFSDTPCLPGLFLASLFSASLSTMSSLLCGMSAIFWEDVVKPHTKPMSDRRAILITRLSVVLFGMLGIAVAFVVSGLTGPISQIMDTTESCLVGAVCGVFILGWLIPWANSTGALVGGSVSVLFVGWVSFGQYASSGVRVTPQLPPASIERCVFPNTTYNTRMDLLSLQSNVTTFFGESDIQAAVEPHGLDLLYSLSYKWLGPIGILIVISVGSLVSRLQVPTPVDPSLVVPVCDLICCCIPTSIRKRLRCGVNYTEAYDATSEEAESAIPNGRSSQADTAIPMLTGQLRTNRRWWTMVACNTLPGLQEGNPATRSQSTSGTDSPPTTRLQSTSGTDSPPATRSQSTSGTDSPPATRLQSTSRTDSPPAKSTTL